jgi:hypothetical protein
LSEDRKEACPFSYPVLILLFVSVVMLDKVELVVGMAWIPAEYQIWINAYMT